VTGDWRSVCQSDDVDAIVVCTPHVHHFEQARTALTNAKHLLVETPLCLSYDEAQGLADLAGEDDLVVHHGVQPRYHPDHQQDIEDLRRGGRLVYAEALSCFDGGPHRPWYRDFALSGGAFSFVPWGATDFFEAFGEVAEVDGRCAQGDKLEVATMWVRFADGGEAKVTYGTGEDIPGATSVTVIGEEGTVQWTGDSPKRLFQAEETIELPAPREVDVVLHECQAFVEEIRGQREFRPMLDLDLRIMKAVSEAQAKAEEKGTDHV